MRVVYTSINYAYLAKARVLAQSVRRWQPDAKIVAVLVDEPADELRQGIAAGREPFDEVLTPDELEIPHWRSWLFQHDVVEACTGVKGAALDCLLRRDGVSAVVYLDPDIALFSSLEPLFAELEAASILLTPHCPVAETELDPIVFNEISSLAHGVYNLGFLGVKADAEGRRLAAWWRHRLHHFCHDNVPRGLFTDQRWCDLIPCQFEHVRVLRSSRYNAASWNVTQRHVSGAVPDSVTVDDQPLVFYHFSGVNSGIPERMYAQFGLRNPTLLQLIEWYRTACQAADETSLSSRPWRYARYENGEPITRAQRIYYREHPELHVRFADPFRSGPGSYRQWLEHEGPGLDEIESLHSNSLDTLQRAAAELAAIRQTQAYKLYRRVMSLGHSLLRVCRGGKR